MIRALDEPVSHISAVQQTSGFPRIAERSPQAVSNAAAQRFTASKFGKLGNQPQTTRTLTPYSTAAACIQSARKPWKTTKPSFEIPICMKSPELRKVKANPTQ